MAILLLKNWIGEMMSRSIYIYILGNRSMFNFHHNYKFVLFMGIGREGGRERERERKREREVLIVRKHILCTCG